jgi:hypothetical protein
VGEEQANNFLDYGDDYAGDTPNSLHYKFVIAHRKVMATKGDENFNNDAGRHVEERNWKCSVFLERLTSTFMERAKALQLLETPTGLGAAEQAAAADAEKAHR